MFTYGGNNNFGKHFDFFEWNAPFYENQAEVYRALEESGIKGKKIAAVNVIGNISTVRISDLYNKIREAGIKPAPDWYQSYANLNKILVPHQISACEPLQLVFDDGTTFEILPTEYGGARVGTNSIPAGLVNGLNDSNFNSKKFYKEFIGKELEGFDLKEIHTETRYINQYTQKRDNGYVESRTKYEIRFEFEHPVELRLTQDWKSYYSIDGCREYYIWDKIPYKKVREAQKKVKQVFIANGRDGGGTFWITCFNRNDENCIDRFSCDSFGISIDDGEVYTYLSEFLEKYYDPNLQERENYGDEGFEWYGNNYFTFDTMRTMISEIRETAKKLRKNFDDPSLDAVKSHFPHWDYSDDDCFLMDPSPKKLTDAEINEIRRKHLPIALDFYERFCTRIEKMMQLPGNDTVSFAGP